jgi:phosphonate transport system substrate-binding protein
MLSRRLLLVQSLLLVVVLLVVGCNSKETVSSQKLTIGVVSYGEGAVSIDKYERFRDYLAEKTNAIVELEPAYNELQAVEQIQRNNWSIVFAPPGLAAIAIGRELYIPLFPMEGVSSGQRSVIVVRQASPIQELVDLSYKTIALREPGSAAGYYLPLYDLYGLTMADVRFAPTPKTVLAWLSQGTVEAGALSEKQFNRYQREFEATKFRIIHTTRRIPPGVVLLGPTVERNQQKHIRKVMSQAPPTIIADAGYVPSAKIPNYEQFIQIVEKVKPLESRVQKAPAALTMEKGVDSSQSAE